VQVQGIETNPNGSVVQVQGVETNPNGSVVQVQGIETNPNGSVVLSQDVRQYLVDTQRFIMKDVDRTGIIVHEWEYQAARRILLAFACRNRDIGL
jgi:hypothetical protein